MKRIYTFLLFFLSLNTLMAQNWGDEYCITFDEPAGMDHLFTDTVNYPNNIWQIGDPDKAVFHDASTFPNAIVTDTVNSYPANNTSVFIIKDVASEGTVQGIEVFNAMYYVNSDTLNDYGIIEFSADMGLSWINLLDPAGYRENIKWFSDIPVLSGNSNGWKWLQVYMYDITYYFDIEIGDTILYRFSFISDGNPESLDGLMFDDVCFQEFVEGITEIRFKPIKTDISPNPGSDLFRIDFKNPGYDSFQLNIYDESSHLMISDNSIKGNLAEFSAKNLASGVYIYKLTNTNRHERGWGKFVVSK